jgi:uncharacterized membrane protein (DUF4010 family)
MQWLNDIPSDLINFILVTLFALLIGLEQRRHHWDEKPETLYGTDRTFTFIGILGFILYVLSPDHLVPFLSGGFALVILLSIFYWKRIDYQNKYGFTSIIVVLITYSLAPLIYSEPLWLSFLVVTTVLILTELKPQFKSFTAKMDEGEFIVLAKFLIISGIILPLLPHEVISQAIPISPFKIWLAVVVISGISYLSYLMQRFLFPQKGILITGLLGGLYSSTATTIVLARKSKASPGGAHLIVASIVYATAMMFIRIYVLAFIFNEKLAASLLLPFAVLTVVSFLLGWLVLRFGDKGETADIKEANNKNPLEFKTALVFAGLFVFFALITKYVLQVYGTHGLNVLSLVVGVTDIDPFLLSLFTGKFVISLHAMGQAALIAVTSNNLIKLAYALGLGSVQLRKLLIICFSTIVVVSLFFILI